MSQRTIFIQRYYINSNNEYILCVLEKNCSKIKLQWYLQSKTIVSLLVTVTTFPSACQTKKIYSTKNSFVTKHFTSLEFIDTGSEWARLFGHRRVHEGRMSPAKTNKNCVLSVTRWSRLDNENCGVSKNGLLHRVAVILIGFH